MVEGSRTLPVVERAVVRLVVLDVSDRILLLHTRDLSNPASGTLWELPGGGIEADETYADAAVRELREETGISITPDAVSAPTWFRDVSYEYRGARRLQHELIAAVRLRGESPRVEGSLRVDFESEDLFEARWWTADEIINSVQRFYPRSLPALLSGFLAGNEIKEPFELWP